MRVSVAAARATERQVLTGHVLNNGRKSQSTNTHLIVLVFPKRLLLKSNGLLLTGVDEL